MCINEYMNNTRTLILFLLEHYTQRLAGGNACGLRRIQPRGCLGGEPPRPSTWWRGPWTVRRSALQHVGADSNLDFDQESAPALYKTLKT